MPQLTIASDSLTPAPGRDCRIIRQAVIPMRDGVPLVATVMLPKEEGRYPVVLQRTPYNRAGWMDGAEQFAKAGYIFICQDVRGRYDSGGECDFFIQEANDTPDTIAWIRHQPWCNGKVGMMGPSYLGWVQLYGVARGSGGELPDALLPTFVSGDAWQRGFYNSGPITLFLTYGLCFEFGSRIGGSVAMRYFDTAELSRHLPLRTMDVACGGGEFSLWRAFMDHPNYDQFWQRYSILGHYDRFTMPALLVGGWYDYYPAQTIAQWKNMVAAARTKQIAAGHRLIIGPWGHHHSLEPTKDGQRVVDFGPQSTYNSVKIYQSWFDRVLKGTPPADGLGEHPIHLFVMGRNVWRDEDDWPLARTRYVDYYLHSAGNANTLAGDGQLNTTPPTSEPADHFTYDPADPVPTHGGNHSVGPWSDSYKKLIWCGPTDRRKIEQRPDVLTYTTATLEQDLEVTGPVSLKLWAASSAKDTDFVGRLIDVYPDGKAVNLTEGVVRARFRSGDFSHPKLIDPNLPLEYTIDLQATSNVFLKGHRMRLEVTSSNFPLWDRNLNTGENPNDSSEMKTAQQTILHDTAHPARLVLPVIP